MSNAILTIADLSEYLHIHRTTIYRMLKEGRLPGFRIGSDWRFSLEAIERWLRDQIKTDSGVDSADALQSLPSSLRKSALPGRARRPTRSPAPPSPGPSRKASKSSEDEFTEPSPS
jgi:excisionase family DNA binding protein